LKKVLIIASSAISTYHFRKELITSLQNQQYEVFISCPDDGLGYKLKDLGTTYIDTRYARHGINPFGDYALYKQYLRLLKEIRPTVVLTYTIKPNIYGNLAARRLKIPVISTITGLGKAFLSKGFVNSVAKILYRNAFRKVACVAFQNKTDEEILRQTKIVTHHRFVSLPGSGVNLDQHQLLDYPQDAFVSFLFVGRFVKFKGVEVLIEASRRLKAERANDFSVTLIGYHEGDVKQEIEQAEADGIVLDGGFHEDVTDCLRKSHCVVLPSFVEGMANALLEAAANGRPIIATNISGCREIVEDGVNGYLCEPHDVEGLYTCMKRFLDLSLEEKINMGLASRKLAEANFDRNIVTNTIIEEINRLH